MEQKNKYVAPFTRRVTVELEQGFMSGGSANVQNPNGDNGRIEEHQMNSEFNEEFEWTNNTWN